jgi:hypothetical protein
VGLGDRLDLGQRTAVADDDHGVHGGSSIRNGEHLMKWSPTGQKEKT